jgi:FkbM family methyltransferase
MTRLIDTVRSAGLMPFIKPLAERTASLMGMRIVPETQVPGVGWLGLLNMSIRTVLDIGACRGGFATEILATRFAKAKIHSFEPSPDAFPHLKAKADASDGRHVAHNFGLGETAETLILHSAVDALPASSLLPSTDENKTAFPQTVKTKDLSVEIKVLDEIAASLYPSIEDDLLVKIDVQGFEDRVIRGGRKTIGRARAVIIEVQTAILYEGQPTFRDIFLELDALGFCFAGVLEQFAGADGRVLYFDAVFIRPEGSRT